MPKAYKLFRVSKREKGKLFPLYVNASKETVLNEWLDAESGEIKANGKVKSKIGDLAYRPGWHLSDIPLATHIGVKGEDGEIEFMNPQHVWCECEYSDKVNYQPLANLRGKTAKGFSPKQAYIKEIPVDGFYRYKTNPNMTGDWIIAGSIKVNRILSDKEVREILRKHDIKAMKRYQGDINLEEYGLAN